MEAIETSKDNENPDNNKEEEEDGEENNIIKAQKEEDRNTIFELAIIYKKFSEYLENINNIQNIKDKKDNLVYIISKEFTDDFKNKIKYEEIKDFLNDDENKTENYKKFQELTKSFTYTQLDSILCAETYLYGDLSQIQKDINKGFDFVNHKFLNKFDFGEDLDNYFAYYYKKNNNIMIVFDDKSKLLINKGNDDNIKYHFIDAPVENKDGLPIKRNKTISSYLINRRSKTKKFISPGAKTIKIENEI